MKDKNLLIFSFVVIVLIFIFFAIVDFKIAQSELSANFKTDTFSAMDPEVNLDNIYLHLRGGSDFDKILEDQLKLDLQEDYNVYSYINLKEKFNDSFLGIKVLNEEVLYTPFFSKAKLRILVFFSSSGRTKYFKDFAQGKEVPVYFNSTEGPQLVTKSILNLRDESLGIMTPKAYSNHITQRISKEISNKIKDL